ncbi:MAG: ribosome maturation factor RimP [Mycobacterium sp.]|nr:ribosome maturation factor RimP [Mycobacterium sp.]
MPTGLPSQKQVIELLDGEFARAGFEIEDVVVHEMARPPRITVIADGDVPLDLDTIAALSRSASGLLDAGAGVDGHYILEVSSPGVDRPLTAEKHFRRARGRKADVTLTDGSAITGRLGDVIDGQIRVVVCGDRGARPAVRQIPLGDIAGAVVQVEFGRPDPREMELLSGGSAGDEEGGG